MEKDLKFGVYLDLYGGLLTEKQAEAVDYYYNSDYSLGEISELTGITRQGVRDFIKRGEAILSEAEEKLGLYVRLKGLDEIRDCARHIVELAPTDDKIHLLAEKIIEQADYIQNGEK